MPENALETLAQEAVTFLREMIGGETEATDKSLKIARIASASLGQYISLLKHEHNRERTAIHFARMLYNGSQKEFAEYMRVALPSSQFVTAIVAKEAIAKEGSKAHD